MIAGPEPFTAERWQRFLALELERPVRVRFGRARRDVIVAREQGGALEVRMNRLFERAPADVREATAAWLRSGRRARRACARLDGWIAGLGEELASAPPRRTPVRPRGAVHDLEELRRELLGAEFARVRFPLGEPLVTWGRRGRARRQLQLGSFDPESNLVRLHPVLDQEAVPGFFVRYVLFHELLHAALPTERPREGRAVHHGPGFRRRERAYRDYERALRWQSEHLRALLRSSRTGRPMRAARAGDGPRASLRRRVQAWLFPELAPGSGERD